MKTIIQSPVWRTKTCKVAYYINNKWLKVARKSVGGSRLFPFPKMMNWLQMECRGRSRERVKGAAETPPPPLPLWKFAILSGYPCLFLFHTKNSILSYNISSSPIDHYKETVAIPFLDSSSIQMQDRFSDEERHTRLLLCLVPSILVNKALQLDRMR